MSPDLLSNVIFGIFMSCIGLIAIWQARERSPRDDIEMQIRDSAAVGRSLDSGQDVEELVRAPPQTPHHRLNLDFTTPGVAHNESATQSMRVNPSPVTPAPARNHAAAQPSRANPNLATPSSDLHAARSPNTDTRGMNR